MSFLGTAAMLAIAAPASHLFGAGSQLAIGLALFAPGLAGYGLVACLSRVLLATGRSRVAATAVAGGWLLVIAVDVAAVLTVPAHWVVGALGFGNTVGLTGAGIALLIAVHRDRGAGALRGIRGTAIMGVVAGIVGAGVGAAVGFVLPSGGPVEEGGVAVLAGCCAVAAFSGVAYALDRGELRAAVARARRAVLR
jgi:putative peptidoglycan lipid II flippase